MLVEVIRGIFGGDCLGRVGGGFLGRVGGGFLGSLVLDNGLDEVLLGLGGNGLDDGRWGKGLDGGDLLGLDGGDLDLGLGSRFFVVEVVVVVVVVVDDLVGLGGTRGRAGILGAFELGLVGALQCGLSSCCMLSSCCRLDCCCISCRSISSIRPSCS